MAKSEKAVYAPGELSRVREKLGPVDQEEARRMAQKLGGEVGVERSDEEEKALLNPKPPVRQEKVEVRIGDRPSRPKRPVDQAPDKDYDDSPADKKKPARKKEVNTDDDPSVPIKANYWERIKMDRFAGQPEFDIKSSAQVFHSTISFFSDIPDMVSPIFVTRRMPEYYKKIETMVVSTRAMFPRNNLRRNERMKKSAPLAYSILDVIRYWSIESISGDLAKIQAQPKSARVTDFANILRAVYKPLFVLEKLDSDAHIRGAYKVLYKLLYLENPGEAEKKYQELIRGALAAFFEIRRDVHYLMYPLFMKAVSSKFVPYGLFFTARRKRIMAFLNVTENDQIIPSVISAKGEAKESKTGGEVPNDEAGQEGAGENKEGQEVSEEDKSLRAQAETEKKALERGLQTLEALFPKAGWDRLSSFPDLYPYFTETLDLKKGIVNIAPTDPMQQIIVLIRILEELFFGLREVSFGTVTGSDGNPERLDTLLGEIVNNWLYLFEISCLKEYLPRMAEYIRILEGSIEERSSVYTKKLVAELHWIKKLYFLPYYQFETLTPPPIQKNEVTPIYSKINDLRRYLSSVAAGIEQGNKAGGAGKKAQCAGIDNPWQPYLFQVPNPLSKRLDALLSPKSRNNASLIYFCLAITTVLDYLVNNENSWAYSSRPGPLFRSENGDGVTPLTGVDELIDAEGLFKQSLRQRQKGAQG